ncbi:MAG: hypothetical protein US62_C0012G0030 [Candidatus Woesebacteria bacterium GW2011_GWA1_37_8]|uniref:Uncharacterized protein n=2 Tax=Candidatus Woeseibacteriota TaxID=1752722 RepID=A0A0G0NL44_9BACT|nr:MAG: hypothetical protein US39_C0014G0041 [Microgenomates group bacterium GW2011_GWC1_37_12b]KKQ45616.1 MAG: hypothetical protein US62_C0012G0030 [Candidatus Woesebacteria bacterium GW2011_GWA1_37_8]KKQ86589.1 MAG: hypothetical protein UT10_C0021G0006 [Candidatus Woesebacteria bacterium GW2011_GWB1_38_8b]
MKQISYTGRIETRTYDLKGMPEEVAKRIVASGYGSALREVVEASGDPKGVQVIQLEGGGVYRIIAEGMCTSSSGDELLVQKGSQLGSGRRF